jgi:hypothetical protein
MKDLLNGHKAESPLPSDLVIHRKITNVTLWLLVLGYVIYQL